MNTSLIQTTLAAGLLLSTLSAPLSTAFAQGSLTPPGAPAPTMKTLGQVEPRTPISAAPFTITSAGSYYLTTNLTVASGNAITISTNGVTLDLNGFTIASTAPSATGCGILLSGPLVNVTIRNGNIQGGVTNNGSGVFSGTGFQHGIYYLAGWPVLGTRVTGVSVSGCLGNGVYLGTGDATVIESCTVRTVGGLGLVAAAIRGSVALDCGTDGVVGREISDSQGQATGSGNGVNASTAQNCFGQSSSGNGLLATTALNCFGASATGTGLSAWTASSCRGTSSGSSMGLYADYTAQDSCGFSSTGQGLYAVNTAQNCYGVSSATNGTGHGLNASMALNCRGSASGTGYGLNATIAQNCYGASTNGYGLNATSAMNCRGYSYSGPGLVANMANSCYGFSSSGTGLSASYGNFCFGSSVP